MTKFLIIGDLHGAKPKIHFKDFDAIIVPGDVCSDKGIRKYVDIWKKEVKKGMIISSEEFEEQFGKANIKKSRRESIKIGNKILKSLDVFGKPIFFVPGNWDQSYGKSRIKDEDESDFHSARSALDMYAGDKTNKKIKKGIKNFYDCQFKLYKFPEFNILGYGLVSAPEDYFMRFDNKKEKANLKKRYYKLVNRLQKQYKRRDKNKPTIFLTHNVPYNTKLDKVLEKGSYAYGKHYGSVIAKEFCKKNHPLVCIGGHMHEHFGKVKIGKTVAINAGFGGRVNILLEIKDGKIKQLKFYKGKK